MCNFNNLPEKTKEELHLFMQQAAQKIGGTNYLLSLIESIRRTKPHPLMQKNSQIASNNTIIKWNKVIFKDKVDLIQELLTAHKENEEKDFNLLNTQSPKPKKNIINMARTLSPLEFIVSPQNPKDGEGFSFKAFSHITDDSIIFDPLFIAIFFCSAEFSKKAIKYSS